MTEIEAIEAGFEKIAAALSVPQKSRLWSVEQISAYFSVSPSTAYSSILCKPDFPEAIKIAGGPKRYVSGEVIAWAERCRERKGKKAA